MISKLGQFLLLIGIVLLAVYWATDAGGDPQFGLFFLGLLLAGLGLFAYIKGYRPSTDSGRFRTLRLIISKLRRQPAKKK
jgi:hypothetical protein